MGKQWLLLCHELYEHVEANNMNMLARASPRSLEWGTDS